VMQTTTAKKEGKLMRKKQRNWQRERERDDTTRHNTTREVARAVACCRSQPTWLIPNCPLFSFLRHLLPLRCPTLISCPIPCLILCSLHLLFTQ
jgi:hypothetical protein